MAMVGLQWLGSLVKPTATAARLPSGRRSAKRVLWMSAPVPPLLPSHLSFSSLARVVISFSKCTMPPFLWLVQ